jgi:hypothetical protein
MPHYRVPDVALPPCRGGGGKKAAMTEITPRPGQGPEPRPGPWPQQQDVLYCENTGCLIRRRQQPAAVTLASIWSGALTLSCDECARRQYNHRPGSYRVLPLSEYRDWYAVAKSQMRDGVAVVTAEVINEDAALSPAPVVPRAAAISAWGPAPAPAAAASGPQPGSCPGAPAAGPGGNMSRQAARTLLGAGIAVTACVAFGVFLIAWGVHLQASYLGGTYCNAPWSFWGVIFMLMPLWAGIGWVVLQVVKFSAQQHRRYREWKASLTPQQRAAADLAEAAAMTAAVVAMRQHHKCTNARLSSSVMGHAMPDGHTMRPTDRLASYR